MPAPSNSTHRDMQLFQPFYPAYQPSTFKSNIEQLVKTPLVFPPQPTHSGPIVGMKVLDPEITSLDDPNQVFVTYDGINWYPGTVPIPGNFLAKSIVRDLNTDNFVLEDANGLLYITTDGFNWTPVDMDQTTYGFLHLLSFTGEYLWATSFTFPRSFNPLYNYNELYVSSDGGVTWMLSKSMNNFSYPKGFKGVVWGNNIGVPV